jgi:hypothetical protein
VAASFWFDSFNPGAVYSLGPRHDSLKDTLWAELRLQRARAGLPDVFIGPSAPEMRDAPDHWAKALTASKDASLTGRHLPRMLFILEEACGVDPIYWQVVQTMFDPGLGHSQLCIFNPTDTTSQAKLEDDRASAEDGTPRWHRHRLSVLDHPNITAELDGRKKPVPGAVSLAMVGEMVRDWCEPVDEKDRVATDIEWPPPRQCNICKGGITDGRGSGVVCGPLDEGVGGRGGGGTVHGGPGDQGSGGPAAVWAGDQPAAQAASACPACGGAGFVGGGLWHRPGPIFQARAMGLWPDTGLGVWSESLWQACLGPPPPFPLQDDELPRIGIDTATGHGDDWIALHVRWGAVSVLHETSNTMRPTVIVGKAKEMCRTLAEMVNSRRAPRAERLKPEEIPIAVDDDGTGGAVVSFLLEAGHRAVAVGAGCAASRPGRYPRKRDELWFLAAEKARAGLVNFSLLDRPTQRRLKQQLLAPAFELDSAGRRAVEPKDQTREKIGRSPDEADAVNLAYHELGGFEVPPAIETPRRELVPQGRRSFFNRGGP